MLCSIMLIRSTWLRSPNILHHCLYVAYLSCKILRKMWNLSLSMHFVYLCLNLCFFPHVLWCSAIVCAHIKDCYAFLIIDPFIQIKDDLQIWDTQSEGELLYVREAAQFPWQVLNPHVLVCGVCSLFCHPMWPAYLSRAHSHHSPLFPAFFLFPGKVWWFVPSWPINLCFSSLLCF